MERFAKGFKSPDETRKFKAHGQMDVLKFGDAATVGRGVFEAGLWITVFPQAKAGAIFHRAWMRGKFHGVMAATTPTGSRRV